MSQLTFQNKVMIHKDKMYRYAFCIVKQRDLALDVVQDVLMTCWENMEDLNKVRNTEAWCMRMTRNQALQMFRQKSYQWDRLENANNKKTSLPDPMQYTESQEEHRIVQKAIESLPDFQQEAIMLRDFQGYAYQEIADITGESLSNVKIAIHRARKTLVQKLSQQLEYGQTRKGLLES
jgi:RNA polymerase sigma factor (sigma-70 family)